MRFAQMSCGAIRGVAGNGTPKGIFLNPEAYSKHLLLIGGISILTKGGGPAMEIRRKDGFFSFQHNEYTGFSQVMPGPDTTLAIKELGSILREIQQTGGYSEK